MEKNLRANTRKTVLAERHQITVMEITLHFATQGFGIENMVSQKSWIIKSCLLVHCFIRGEFQHVSWRKASYRTPVDYYRKITACSYSHNTLLLLSHTISDVSWHTELCIKIASLQQSKCWRQVFLQCCIKVCWWIPFNFLLHPFPSHSIKEGSWKLTHFFSPNPSAFRGKIRFGARITTTCIVKCRLWE